MTFSDSDHSEEVVTAFSLRQLNSRSRKFGSSKLCMYSEQEIFVG